VIDTPSILSVIRKVASLERVLPTFAFRVVKNTVRRKWIVHWWIEEEELMKLQKAVSFPMILY
jgi:hypothetical protein